MDSLRYDHDKHFWVHVETKKEGERTRRIPRLKLGLELIETNQIQFARASFQAGLLASTFSLT